MTWPLAARLGTAVANPGDPYLNVFILDWDWFATVHHPLALFDAPIFHPARNALAFSENLYGIALFLFPLRALGVTPIAAYNVAMLAGFALSGFVVYLLGRQASGSALAGIAAGIFYAFVPWRFVHLSHVQYVWGWTLPLMLYALLRRSPVLFGVAFLLNGLSNLHAFLFGAVAIAIAAAIVRPPWKPFLAATAIAGALLLPFLLPYRDGIQRPPSEVMHYSATARDWIANVDAEPERRLFPGYIALIWSAAALPLLFRKREGALAAAWILLGFLGSLGLHTVFHRFLYAHVPGFGGMRVPARWAMVAYAGIALLIALGSSRRRWLAIAGAVALLVELRVAPIRWYIARPDAPPVYRAIAGARAVIELPIESPYREYESLLRATTHHTPIANGISGFEPPEHARLAAKAYSDDFFAELQRIGIDRVLVHGDNVPPAARAWLARELDRGHLAFLGRFDNGVEGDWLFSMNGRGANRPAALDDFLGGRRTFNEETFGFLNYPQPGETLRGGSFFAGFAFSPYGIRRVDFLFNNGAVRIPAMLQPDARLSREYPWYGATPLPSFVGGFDRRPPNVRPHADVQVEITDGRGRKTRLEDRWFEWP